MHKETGMDASSPVGLLRFFDALDDPRPGTNVMHLLTDMLAIAITAVICGAESWSEVAYFGRCKEKWFRTFLRLPHGIASHDTFGRVFGMIDPDQFERCFMAWTAYLSEDRERLVALDGKTLRKSFDSASDRSAIHLVSAWCETNHTVLGQLAVEEKSNEITAIPKLLELLDLNKTTVTIDAMGCQRKIAETIVEGGGDYILQVKDNQPTLRENLELLFAEAIRDDCHGVAYDYATKTNKGHGRIETRRCWTSWEVRGLAAEEDSWRGLKSVVCVERRRQVGDEVSQERHYYISSLPGRDAAEMSRKIRSHWGVENRLHWCLDVQMNEDACRIRQGHAAENFSRLRRMALNQLKKDKTIKLGLRGKSKACSWDHDVLIQILTG